MPLFDYQVIDAGGKKRTGVIEAHDEREVKEKLREQGLMVSKLSPKETVVYPYMD